MTKCFLNTLSVLVTAFITLAMSAGADVLFDNSKIDLKLRFDPASLEVGDQIVLNGPATMTNFSFDYWGTSANGSSFAGANVQARVRFYRNDGAPFNGHATPSSILYDSSWFSIPAPTARQTVVFTGGTAGSDFGPSGILLPDSGLTWSVQFSGMAAGDHLGVDLFDSTGAGTVGGDYPDYWENVSSSWQRMQVPGQPVDFAARIEGVIPEPSTLSLLVFGGLGAILFARRRQQK